MGEELPTANRQVGGRYELEALLGKGGMGEVWRARHVALNSHVAIKFLSGASAHRTSTRKRFLTEAQVAAQLKTRHAVHVFDFGVTDEGLPYLVMELLDGETLGHRLGRLGRLPIASTVRFLVQAARALERAHALGIVHRDFKPDNVVVTIDEEGKEYVKVLDFGIAKLLNDLESEGAHDDEPPTDVPVSPKAFGTFTRTGTILGTPLYMAPEQVMNASTLDLRADIWAFGVVAFQLLTGTAPFEAKNLIQLFERIQLGVHPTARSIRPELPPAFDDWFGMACAVDPNERFATAKEAANRLAMALEPSEGASAPDLSLSTSSGERPYVSDPGSDANAAAAIAATIDAAPQSSGVRSSDRRPSQTGAPPPDRLARVSAPPPSSRRPPPAAPTKTAPSMPPPARTGVAMRKAALLAMAALAGALILFAATRGSAPTAPAAGASAASAAPTSTPPPDDRVAKAADTAAPDPIAPPGDPRAAENASAPAGNPATRAARPLASSPTPHASAPPAIASVAPPATAATTTATAATTTAPPSPPPATASASPYKLPPLGI